MCLASVLAPAPMDFTTRIPSAPGWECPPSLEQVMGNNQYYDRKHHNCKEYIGSGSRIVVKERVIHSVCSYFEKEHRSACCLHIP